MLPLPDSLPDLALAALAGLALRPLVSTPRAGGGKAPRPKTGLSW